MDNSEMNLKTVLLKDPFSQKVYPVKVSIREAERLNKHWTGFSKKLETSNKKNDDSVEKAIASIDNDDGIDNADNIESNNPNAEYIEKVIHGKNILDTGFHWQPPAVKILLEEIRARQEYFTGGGYQKKQLWEDISLKLHSEGYEISSAQCQNKFSGLKKTHRRIKLQLQSQIEDGNIAVNSSWPYYDIIEELEQRFSSENFPLIKKRIRAIKDESEFDSNVVSNEFDPNLASTPHITTPKRQKVEPAERVVEVIRELAQESENNKERRFKIMLEEKRRQFKLNYQQQERTIKLLTEILNQNNKS